MLLIALAAVAYSSGRNVQIDSDLITQDAVPGTINAHYMRMAMARSLTLALAAASAKTAGFRDRSLKAVHEADEAFAAALKSYEGSIRKNPRDDQSLLEQVKKGYAAYNTKRLAFESLILAGDREAASVFLEQELAPAYLSVLQSAEELLKYNHGNSISLSGAIHRKVSQLYWAVAVVMVLALACALVLVFNLTTRRRELAELEENEEKFSKAFKSNPGGLAITEIETGRFIEVNDSYCRLIGFSPEEVVGHTSLELGIWGSAEERSRRFRPLTTGASLRDMEMNAITRDGSRREVSVNADPIDLGGRRCVISSVVDITERKELQRKQAQLASIVEFSEDAIIGKSMQGIITSWNFGAEKIFGYTAVEVIGQPLTILFPPDRMDEEVEMLAKIARGETVQHFETVRVRKDGRWIFISATISPLKDSQGRVIGASKIARDITAQKQAFAALRESEERIRILGDNLPTGMMYQLDMGPDGKERRFTYVSAGVERLHEVTAEAVMQDAAVLYGQVVAEDRPRVAAREAEALAAMKPFMAELRMQLPSGAVRWSLFTSAPRRTANGHVVWDGIELDITAQKRADEALRDKQDQLILAMDIAKLAHWEFDVVKNTVSADEHIFRLLGTTSEQEGGLSMSPEEYVRRFVHPEDAGIIATEVALGIAAHDPHFARQFEHRVTRRDGVERVMLVRSRILMDGSGRTGKILGTNQDITEQKQSELRIRQLNRIYAVLSGINKTIVLEKDRQEILMKACQIAVGKGGFCMAWVGMHDAATHKVLPVASAGVVDGYLDLVNIDLTDKTRRSGTSGTCFLSGEHVTCSDVEHDPLVAPWREALLKRGCRSSASFPIKVGGKVIGNINLYSGEVGFFNEEETLLLDELAMDIGFALEVGESEARRRQAEQELRWRTAFFEAQVHSAIDGILVLDSAGKKLLQNRRMNELWKIPPSIADDPDDSRQLQFLLAQVKEPEAFLRKISHLNAHPDESSTDVIEQVDGTIVERHSAPVRGSDGTHYGRVWTFHDITERKKLESQFLRAQRMESIGTLASGVAHDLNNILTPIMMSVAVLRLGMSAEKRDSLCDTIEMSAARGAQIVKQVLAFGRGLEGERHPLQVELLIDEMEQMIRSTFPKDITVECVKAPHLWLVLGDATQLHQVLLNLCVNARDAMPGGGRLRLSAENLDIDASYASMVPEITPGPHVLLEVADTGSGIPPEILERIFDPFFTTKELGKGTGLGLSTVHGIIKSHGGFLKVVTEPGKGTTFQIYMPAAPEQQAMEDATASAPDLTGHGECVLVVDDELEIASAARTVLEANGYRVLVANDAAQALVMFTENAREVALVLTDLMMPVMNGELLLRTLRKINPGLPVIASTGLCDQAQLATMKALGVDAVLLKPYNSTTLLRTINGVLHPRPEGEKPLDSSATIPSSSPSALR
ncbi:MAG: PAS domain S-box protein [Verrucomicrobia bacterium]|nr:PAS domain S-box protein [Verrucomicrobiota bacterium]